MGITGLLPFLEKSSKKTNISEFSGKTVAIDSYCWLHKGAFSCADKIIMGQKTDAYVKYCMKFVNMLLSHNIKPILVFDGRHLPAKAETEVKRRESRESNRRRATELMKMGKTYEGKNLLRRSLDVSHKMALEVIKECQAHNVDCIVAPYEADAQLAYLSISGIADVIITEDSDLTLFGCKKIFFKMDMYGYGVLVEQDRLHLAMGLQLSNFHMDKFRYMCILSGCDYLASLPGIGLGKACKFIVKNTDDNIYNALQRLASSLNMKSLVVTKEYRDNFMRALTTFKHQLVYCPLQRKQVRLNPPTSDITLDQLQHAGSEIDAQLAWQLALGNCDPFTYEKLHNFDPDKPSSRLMNSWSETTVAKHKSIWSKTFKIQNNDKKSNATSEEVKKLPAVSKSTRGQVMVMRTDSLKKEITPRKRTFEECEMEMEEIVDIYKNEAKRSQESKKSLSAKVEADVCSSDEQTSPIIVKRSNPFRKTNESNEISPSLVNRIRRRLPIKSRLKPTVIDDKVVIQSKFFASESKTKIENEKIDILEFATNNANKQGCKENLELLNQKVVIPETEIFNDEMHPEIEKSVNKDSGFNGSDEERDINVSTMSGDISVTEKEPLHAVDNNSLQQNEEIKVKSQELKTEKTNEPMDINDEEFEFTITREAYSESRSSLFQYESPVTDKKWKRNGNSSQSSQRGFQLLQRSSNRRSSRSNSKKSTTIQGQQSLLNMFSFQKKEYS